jgi:hypothetical protein
MFVLYATRYEKVTNGIGYVSEKYSSFDELG